MIEEYQKVLIVDDEFLQCDKEDFIDEIGLTEDLAFFASTYEDAKLIIDTHDDILLCFVDCKIPKDKNSLYDFTDEVDEGWGLSLIEYINEKLKNTQIAIYSAYVAQISLKEKIKLNNYKNIFACYDKPEIIKDPKILYSRALESQVFNKEKLRLKLDISKARLNSIASKDFDYDSLTIEDKEFILQKAAQIRFLMRRSLQDVIIIGKSLIEIKERLKHGQFKAWVKFEFGDARVNYPTINRFMRAYSLLESIDLVDIQDKEIKIIPSAIYSLCNANLDKEALLEMKHLAESGFTININVANSLKRKYKKIQYVDNEEQNESLLENLEIEKYNDLVAPQVDKNKIVKVIRKQKEWKIGNHFLRCAEPTIEVLDSLKFNFVELCMCFPRQSNWSLNSNLSYMSQFSFYSCRDELISADIFLQIKTILERSTEDYDLVLICYVPNLNIIKALDQYNCQGYIIEPDYDKCLEIVELYK